MLNTILITVAIIIIVSLLSWLIFRKKGGNIKDNQQFVEMTDLSEEKKEEKNEEKKENNELKENKEDNLLVNINNKI